MLVRTENNTMVIFADDLHDAAEYLLRTPRQWRQRASEGNAASRDWDMGVGYSGAWRLANDGWTQGAADLHTAIQAIEPDAVLPELKFDMGGERVDIARYLGGNPACMVTHGRQTKQKPVVHLIVNGVVSGGVSSAAIAAYGAALTAVIDAIENGGRRVELDMVYAFSSLSGSYYGSREAGRALVGWKIKRAEDHLDLSAVAFSVAHPAAFRRIGFALAERTPREWDTPGYGRCGTVKTTDLEMLGSEGAFILPGVGESYFGVDPKAAIPRAIAQINEIAGEEIVSVA